MTKSKLPLHPLWIRISHWTVTFCFFLLVFTGAEMTMVHPRFYWGEAGNDLTPALFELPVSRNYKHGGWTASTPFFDTPDSPTSAGRTYDIFNQNGWGRSLHFLMAWILAGSGILYFLFGVFTRHFSNKIVPSIPEIRWRAYWNDFLNHFKKVTITHDLTGYGLLQKTTYGIVIFIVMPIIILTGLTMSPAVTAGYPILLKLWGAQSARTIHFMASTFLVVFLVIHLTMIIRTGFKKQIRQMITGR